MLGSPQIDRVDFLGERDGGTASRALVARMSASSANTPLCTEIALGALPSVRTYNLLVHLIRHVLFKACPLPVNRMAA